MMWAVNLVVLDQNAYRKLLEFASQSKQIEPVIYHAQQWV